MDIYTLSNQGGLDDAVDVFDLDEQIQVQLDIINDQSQDAFSRAQAYVDLLNLKNTSEFKTAATDIQSLSTNYDAICSPVQTALGKDQLTIACGDGSSLDLQTANGTNATILDIVKVLQGTETDSFSVKTDFYSGGSGQQANYDTYGVGSVSKQDLDSAFNTDSTKDAPGSKWGKDIQSSSGITWRIDNQTQFCDSRGTAQFSANGTIESWKNQIKE
jgi:hypothetical protein